MRQARNLPSIIGKIAGRKDRESQMLHQEMLNELLQKMQQYQPSVLTEQTEIITLDDTLQESCEITEPSCTEIKTQLPTTQRTTIQQTATKPFSKTTAPSFYWELFPRKQKKKPILPQTKSFRIFPVERKKFPANPFPTTTENLPTVHGVTGSNIFFTPIQKFDPMTFHQYIALFPYPKCG